VNTVTYLVPRATAKADSETRKRATHGRTTGPCLHFRRGRRAPLSPLPQPCRTLREPSQAAPTVRLNGVGKAGPGMRAIWTPNWRELCLRARVNKHRPCPAATGRGGSRRCGDDGPHLLLGMFLKHPNCITNLIF
jgi:hypothetical protein